MELIYSIECPGEHSGHEHLIKKRCWGYLRSCIWTINGPESLKVFKNHEEFAVGNDDGGAACDDVEICTSKSSTSISIFVQLTRRPRRA